jgi:hypothetical protein
MAILMVLLGPARGVVLPPLAVGSPSLDSTKTTSYCPLAVEPLDGVWKIELSYISSTGGRMLDVAEGVYSNRLEPIDSSEVGAYEASETGLDLVLLVELGGGTGGIKNDAGVRRDVVTLLRDFEDVDIGDGIGEALMLDTVVLLRLETEDTVVDLGRAVLWLLMERGVECLCGVDIGLDGTDLLARDMVRDCVGVTLLSVEGSSDVIEVSSTLCWMDGITDGVGVPPTDAT